MKLKVLLKKLNQYDPKLEVVIASDEEGNSFGYLSDVSLQEIEDVPGKFVILWPSQI